MDRDKKNFETQVKEIMEDVVTANMAPIPAAYFIINLHAAALAEKSARIAELEKDNAELRNVAKSANKICEEQMYKIAELEKKLAEAEDDKASLTRQIAEMGREFAEARGKLAEAEEKE